MKTIYVIPAVLLILASCGTPEERQEKKAARIHAAALTVDSHTDTALDLNREGYDFGIRNDPVKTRTKIDLPRIKEGKMDGIWFATFVGQGERTPEGNEEAKQEAYEIIRDIYSTVERFPDDLEIATASGDLQRIAKKGKHAIYLGLENGYPLGNDLSLIDTFYNMGIRYITLVHTDNNDICDSSTDSVEHGGLTPFGREVVERMNDLGILVDVSHASDESFYQVVDASRAPVIASHSCSRAMCDNPRNMTDDMLLRLKENGGVIQMCIFSDYVKTPAPNPERDSARQAVRDKYGEYKDLDREGKEVFYQEMSALNRDFPSELATVSEAVDHIDHIADLIGIDYVGIGTDFDGGGGLEDCFDVSQMGNITLELVRRGYTAREIKKIWGGNLTRVFREAERIAAGS